jgi:hypothetical protein
MKKVKCPRNCGKNIRLDTLEEIHFKYCEASEPQQKYKQEAAA